MAQGSVGDRYKGKKCEKKCETAMATGNEHERSVLLLLFGQWGDGFFASSSVFRFVSSQRIVVKSVGGG